MTKSFNGTLKVDETPTGLGESRAHSKCLLPMTSIFHVLIFFLSVVLPSHDSFLPMTNRLLHERCPCRHPLICPCTQSTQQARLTRRIYSHTHHTYTEKEKEQGDVEFGIMSMNVACKALGGRERGRQIGREVGRETDLLILA